MVKGMLFWTTLGSLMSVDTTLESTAYLNIAADHLYLFMVIIFPHGDGHFLQDKTTCHFLNWFKKYQSLTCYHGPFSPLTSIQLCIFGKKSKYHFKAWKHHHLIFPNFELPFFQHFSATSGIHAKNIDCDQS
ncbi:hypothetical protein TNCT_358151 [Trichonephila clavata]|uniref:Secreted protein n=1 Tax=Trichonephila clavata TaxID=2740835 RepID=A0A8X6KVP7_TRICU|nr:hypothetical protein TNCT_358151 [Trichonephila clavata]